MKKLLYLFLDGLTYKDLAGKRQPRTYIVLAGIVLFLLFVLFAALALEHKAMMDDVLAKPHPLEVTVLPTMLQTVSITELPAQPTSCPTEPEDWSLADVFVSQNYKLIQPACVYDGLAHTIAWALAVRQGYSRADATILLDFAEMPIQQMTEITAIGISGDPENMPLSFIPPHPDLSERRVNANGEQTIVYALRGCFRTSMVVGNKIEIWGGDYPVICVVVEDAENTNIIYALDGHIFTSPASPTRTYHLFGYAGDGLWIWLGARENPKTPIDDPTRFANDRLTIATLYGSQPWDAIWLKEHYNLTMQPLPENWQDFKDDNEMQAILTILNKFMGGQ